MFLLRQLYPVLGLQVKGLNRDYESFFFFFKVGLLFVVLVFRSLLLMREGIYDVFVLRLGTHRLWHMYGGQSEDNSVVGSVDPTNKSLG